MNDQKEKEHGVLNYTRVPNMLVDGYSDLLPQEKWCFVCLQRLCGKEGTRFLSLRYISEHTGFSLGALAKNQQKNRPGMLSVLEAHGLIHVTQRKMKNRLGKEQGQKQYHVTITDTWNLNYEYFYGETPCSSVEDITNESESVLQSNTLKDESVLQSNTKCSTVEHWCSTVEHFKKRMSAKCSTSDTNVKDSNNILCKESTVSNTVNSANSHDTHAIDNNSYSQYPSSPSSQLEDEDITRAAIGITHVDTTISHPPSGQSVAPQEESPASCVNEPTKMTQAKRAKKEKAPVSSEIEARRRALKATIVERCGELDTGKLNTAENIANAYVIDHYSDEDIHAVIEYLITKSWRWKQDQNKYKLRGYDIRREMQPTLRLFAEKPSERPAPVVVAEAEEEEEFDEQAYMIAAWDKRKEQLEATVAAGLMSSAVLLPFQRINPYLNGKVAAHA